MYLKFHSFGTVSEKRPHPNLLVASIYTWIMEFWKVNPKLQAKNVFKKYKITIAVNKFNFQNT